MKPISRGKGRESYTLYYPLYISDNFFKINLDNDELVSVLLKILPEKTKIEILPRTDVTILKISENKTFTEAEESFNILQKYFITLAIRKSITIYLEREPLKPDPCPFTFFPTSPAAKQLGWDTDENESINIDGIVNITRPCILAEHKKIVDADVLIGRPGSRKISKKDLNESIVENLLPELSDRQTLAINAFLTSFSLPDQRLAYLLIFICLEILAADHCKVKHYAGRKDFVRLLSDYKQDILKEMHSKYHLGFKPESLRDDLYDLRKKIAHELNLGSTNRSEFSEIYHIAKLCATTIVRKMINHK